MKNIKLIIGSTRQGRNGKLIADWLVSNAKENGVNLVLLDIADFNLPFFEAAKAPSIAHTTVPEAIVWAEAVEDTDAFVFLTAEYNGSIPAPLKNAMDFLKEEWEGKQAVIVSYGFGGGKEAAGHLKGIFRHLDISAVGPDVSVQFGRDSFNEYRQIKDIDVTMAPAKESFLEALDVINKVQVPAQV